MGLIFQKNSNFAKKTSHTNPNKIKQIGYFR